MNDGVRVSMFNNFYINENLIQNTSIQSQTSYLGIPLAMKLSRKKQHLFQKILNIRNDVSKLSKSELSCVQTNDANKNIFYQNWIMNYTSNAAPTVKLKETDEFIENKIILCINTIDLDSILQNIKNNAKKETIVLNPQIEHNSIKRNDKTIISEAIIKHHSINQKNETRETEAVVEHHKINPVHSLKETEARVVHHTVKPIHESIESVATIENHSVKLTFKHVEFTVTIESHSVKPTHKLVESLVEHYVVVPKAQTFESTAIVQSNVINDKEEIKENDVLIQQNIFTPHFETIHNTANILSHVVTVNDNVLESEAIVEHHLFSPAIIISLLSILYNLFF